MILTRAFFARPRGGRHSHAPGCAPDNAGLSIEGMRIRVVENNPQRNGGALHVMLQMGNYDEQQLGRGTNQSLTGGLFIPRPGSIFVISRLGSVF